MTNPWTWLRRQRDRYRAWREARGRDSIRRLIEQAMRPENVERLRRSNEEEYGRLVLNDDGFSLLKRGRSEFAVRWADIRSIRTFKRDLFAHDMICLGFEVGESGWAEIWESMVDFRLVTERMETEFPTIPRDWYSVVMVPAFEPNERMLWQKSRSA